jgi:hypothetical protein
MAQVLMRMLTGWLKKDERNRVGSESEALARIEVEGALKEMRDAFHLRAMGAACG